MKRRESEHHSPLALVATCALLLARQDKGRRPMELQPKLDSAAKTAMVTVPSEEHRRALTATAARLGIRVELGQYSNTGSMTCMYSMYDQHHAEWLRCLALSSIHNVRCEDMVHGTDGTVR